MPFTAIRESQNEFLVNYLQGTGRKISSAQAASLFGIRRLPARIHELAEAGYRVRRSVNSYGRVAYSISRRRNEQ